VPNPSFERDRSEAFALTPVSRETEKRLETFVQLLLQWQRKTNLIAPSTLPDVWRRHVADSLQLLDVAGRSRTWIDLGSGGGFPGGVIACALAEVPGAMVHLVESNTKKAAFLREAVRLTDAPASVHHQRIEDFDLAVGADVVTARALAPLTRLLELSFRLLKRGAVGIFPKGQDVDAELTEASKYWNMTSALVPSRTDPGARIVVISALERRAGASE
jgi:16S rRNA (guanine527-N7)-methyltransferase